MYLSLVNSYLTTLCTYITNIISWINIRPVVNYSRDSRSLPCRLGQHPPPPKKKRYKPKSDVRRHLHHSFHQGIHSRDRSNNATSHWNTSLCIQRRLSLAGHTAIPVHAVITFHSFNKQCCPCHQLPSHRASLWQQGQISDITVS